MAEIVAKDELFGGENEIVAETETVEDFVNQTINDEMEGADMLAANEEEAEHQVVLQGSTWTRVEDLQAHGINMSDIKKLKEGGFATVLAVKSTMKKELGKIKGMSEDRVNKILAACDKIKTNEGSGSIALSGFVTCRDLQAVHAYRCKISTGSSQLDEILGGGVETCTISEFYGEYKSGKTQIMHSLALNAQKAPEEGGGGGKVMYIDTEGTFRPDRIVQMANAQNLEPESMVDNILVARCMTSEHLMKLIGDAGNMMASDESPYALVIVDSIMGVFRFDYCGRGELADRQQALGQVMSKLQKLAEEFNVAIAITNQVMADPGATSGGSFAGAAPKPIGGHILAHMSTCRLQCKNLNKEGNRRIKLVDHPNKPEKECDVVICEAGIRNAD